MRKPFAEYKEFRGENTVSDSLALKDGEVQVVTDIDFDIDRGAHRKQLGSILRIAGIYDNIWSNGKIMLATDNNGDLLRIFENDTTAVLRSNVGTAPMSYVDVAGTGLIYYSNKIVIGYIRDGVSNVMTSTTVSDRVDTFPMYPIEYFGNRLWGFVGDILWMTDPDPLFYFNRINLEKNFIQRKGVGTLLKAVQDGLFIADGSHYFIGNAGRQDMSINFLCDYDAIPGISTQNPIDIEVFVGEDSQLLSGKAHLWVTEKGIRYGMSGGISGNLTRKRIVMPSGTISGACIVIDTNEQFNRFVAVMRD